MELFSYGVMVSTGAGLLALLCRNIAREFRWVVMVQDAFELGE